MFAVRLRNAEHVRQFSVSNRSAAGWEIKREEDRVVKKHVWCHDWHRVERSLALFEREVGLLTAQGWTIQSPED
jgi:hypothetical protein